MKYRLTVVFDCEADSEEEARNIHAKWMFGPSTANSFHHMTDRDVDCEEIEGEGEVSND